MEKFQISMAAARINAELTQSNVASLMGLTKQTIVSWEKGRVVPKPAQFEMFCRICNIEKDHVFLPKI